MIYNVIPLGIIIAVIAFILIVIGIALVSKGNSNDGGTGFVVAGIIFGFLSYGVIQFGVSEKRAVIKLMKDNEIKANTKEFTVVDTVFIYRIYIQSLCKEKLIEGNIDGNGGTGFILFLGTGGGKINGNINGSIETNFSYYFYEDCGSAGYKLSSIPTTNCYIVEDNPPRPYLEERRVQVILYKKYNGVTSIKSKQVNDLPNVFHLPKGSIVRNYKP